MSGEGQGTYSRNTQKKQIAAVANKVLFQILNLWLFRRGFFLILRQKEN